MRCCYVDKPIFKDVVVIGNGPSGICLSLMLDGWTPFLTSTQHPDEFLSARLEGAIAASNSTTEYGLPLVYTDLLEVAQGLDGRTTNPVSLLYDALMRPFADMGMDLAPLVKWRRTEHQIDHVVLGKGLPGGSWHSMDPHILTLSLASWMALPGLPFTTEDLDSASEKPLRASAQQVASYYETYVKRMNIDKHFANNVIVTQIRPIEDKCSVKMASLPFKTQCEYKWVQKIKNDFKCPKSSTVCPTSDRRCIAGYIRTLIMQRRSGKQQVKKELLHEIFDPNVEDLDRGRALEEDGDDVCADCQRERAHAQNGYRNNRFCACSRNRENNYRGSTKKRKDENNEAIAAGKGGASNKTNITNKNIKNQRPKWLVDIYDKSTRRTMTYTCNTLVLANGAHDLPNKLSLHRANQQDGGLNEQATLAEPHWLLHDVRSLEIELDLRLQTDMRQNGRGDIAPVLVVGAGLSAADAILATRKRNIPVLHVFRSKSSDLIKKLPENMYPEYHKIHQMMMQEPSSSTTPTTVTYTPFPAHTISTIDAETHTITIVNEHTGTHTTHRVSFAAVLIGSRPDLGFLPPGYKLGMRKTLPVDSKTNTVNIDRGSHRVSGFDGLYALGPLAGDNFVRFLPGGCLAAVGDMYKNRGLVEM